MTTKAWIKSAFPRFCAQGRWDLLSHRIFQIKFHWYVTATLPQCIKLLNFREESQAVSRESGSLSCDCHSSRFNYSPLGHVITGDLNIVSNPKLHDIFRKGPKYPLPQKIDWSLNYDLIQKGDLDCKTKWAKKNHVSQAILDEWVSAVLSKVKSKATKLSQWFSFLKHSPFFWQGVKNASKTCMKDL